MKKKNNFMFGPLCPNKKYEILIWANDIKHKRVTVRPEKDFDCLKGYIMPKCDTLEDDKLEKDKNEE